MKKTVFRPATNQAVRLSALMVRILHGVAFSFLIFITLAVAYASLFSPTSWLMALASIALLVTISPVYNNAVSGRPLSSYDTAAMWLVTAAIYGVAAILLVGLVQDVLHSYCAGFFGVRSSCLSVRALEVSITALNPSVYLPIVAVPLALLIYGRNKAPSSK